MALLDGNLAAAFAESGQVDEARVFVAPILLAGGSRIEPAAAGGTDTLMVTGGSTYTNRGDVARSLQYQLGHFSRVGVVTFPQAGVKADWDPALVTRQGGCLPTPAVGASITVDDPRFSTAQVVGPSMLSTDGADHTRHRDPFVAPFRPGRLAERFGAVVDGVVYQALMDPSPCGDPDRDAPGYIVAMDAATGRMLWRFEAGVIESSPLYVDGLLYFGSWDGKVYALDVETQQVRWSFQTGDEVKAAPAYANGTIVIGSYDGRVYALDAATGEERWSTEAQAGVGGAGNFYATPALAYGRVFVGNTDGKVYAFGLESGDLLWSHSTGGFVYSSAAVWERTVYVGSYDGSLYALDAATGDVRWTFGAGGSISGAPVVIDGVVYVSTLEQETFALDARTGKQVWTFPDGKYTPIVADEESDGSALSATCTVTW